MLSARERNETNRKRDTISMRCGIILEAGFVLSDVVVKNPAVRDAPPRAGQYRQDP